MRISWVAVIYSLKDILKHTQGREPAACGCLKVSPSLPPRSATIPQLDCGNFKSTALVARAPIKLLFTLFSWIFTHLISIAFRPCHILFSSTNSLDSLLVRTKLRTITILLAYPFSVVISLSFATAFLVFNVQVCDRITNFVKRSSKTSS